MVLLCGIFLALKVLAAEPTPYSTQVDKEITIHRITIIPFTDNVGGIYSRFAEEAIEQQIKKSHRFDSTPVKPTNSVSLNDLEHDPDLIKKKRRQITSKGLFRVTSIKQVQA